MGRRIFDLDFNSYRIDINTGYGKAAYFLSKSLDKEINVIDRSPNVLNFCMPKDYVYKDITVGYTPWESTELKDGWLEKMEGCDEIWTPCEWNARLFKKLTGRTSFVLPHGIDPDFITIKRHWDRYAPFTFLHVGAPAIRKGDDILFNVWFKHFRKRKDVRLVFKVFDGISARILDGSGSIIAAPQDIPNIVVKSGKYSTVEMWREMVLANCMVYPSRGEGWGFIPFEAIASGLPTIMPQEAMGDFTEYALTLIYSEWVESEDQIIHPGKWLNHSEDELVWRMESMISNYENESDRAYIYGNLIHSKYNWDAIAKTAIDRIQYIADHK